MYSINELYYNIVLLMSTHIEMLIKFIYSNEY